MVSVWLDHLKHGGKSRRKPVFPLLEVRFVKTQIYIDGYNRHCSLNIEAMGLKCGPIFGVDHCSASVKLDWSQGSCFAK